MHFGERLLDLRSRKNMTQAELAEKLGVSRRSVLLYETTERMPRRNVLIKIAEIFDMTVEQLLDPDYKEELRVEDMPLAPNAVTEYGDISNMTAEEREEMDKELQEALEHCTLLFAGGEYPEEDKDKFYMALTHAYIVCKNNANKKNNGKKE